MSQQSPAPSISVLDACDAPEVWRGWFRDPKTWAPWRVFLSVLFGLKLDPAGLKFFQECTGRTTPPANGYDEAWLVVGRRGGKSFILALIACYLAIFRDWRPYLSPGEVAKIMIISVDRTQSRDIYRFCRALLTQAPVFEQGQVKLVERDTGDVIELSNGVVIEIGTANYRSARGFAAIAILCDELAFWRSDETAANPDSEILTALRPALGQIPGSMLLCASSPYSRRGELYNTRRSSYGVEDAPELVWQAATRVMNPTFRQSIIDRDMERDPVRFTAEYGASFRSDIESFVSREVVEGATVHGRHELPKLGNVRYFAFVDPAGGSGTDSFTLAIAHRGTDGVVLDLIRERRPQFSPEQVVGEFAATLRDYGVHRVTGDHYAGEWPREQFRKAGVQYETSDRTKSEIYQDSLPLLNSRKIELLDHPRLISQLCGLERRTARSGRDSIDHGPGSHDDICNSALGALLLASHATARMILSPDQLQRLAASAPRNRFASLQPGAPGGAPGARNRFARAQ